MEGCPIVISRTVLIACGAFDQLNAKQVGSAIARGLQAGGFQTDVCPIVPEDDPPADVERHADARALLEALDLVWLDETALRAVDPELQSLHNINAPADMHSRL